MKKTLLVNKVVSDTSGKVLNLEDDRQIDGYKVPLAQMINRKAEILLEFNDGSKIIAPIHSFDDHTITVKFENDEWPTTFFVSSIRSFTRYS